VQRQRGWLPDPVRIARSAEKSSLSERDFARCGRCRDNAPGSMSRGKRVRGGSLAPLSPARSFRADTGGRKGRSCAQLPGAIGVSYLWREIVTLRARLHPIWVPKVGYRWSVVFRGKLLVDQGRHPECDAARALLARGFIGKLTLLDGKTGKPRTIIDIEKAARLTTEEGPRGPRFVKYRKTVVDRSRAAEAKTA
jgi:hypothetical protein